MLPAVARGQTEMDKWITNQARTGHEKLLWDGGVVRRFHLISLKVAAVFRGLVQSSGQEDRKSYSAHVTHEQILHFAQRGSCDGLVEPFLGIGYWTVGR